MNNPTGPQVNNLGSYLYAWKELITISEDNLSLELVLPKAQPTNAFGVLFDDNVASKFDTKAEAELDEFEEEVRVYSTSLRTKLHKALDIFPAIIEKLLITSEALSTTQGIRVYDYTYIAFDALKCLEAALQIVLKTQNIVIDIPAHLTFGQAFSVTNDTYDTINGRRVKRVNYSPEYVCTLSNLSDESQERLTRSYNFFSKTRHKHFHSSQNIAEMSYIDSREQAVDIISEAYEHIEALADIIQEENYE